MSLAPLRRLQQPRNSLLPLLAAQAFAAVMMLAGRLDFLGWQLLTLIEAWLVHLSLLRFDVRKPLPERLKQFALVSLAVLPALFLFLALLATLMLDPDDPRLPWTMMADAAARAVAGDGRVALGYLAAGLGVSLLQAQRSAEPGRWWYERVVMQYQVNMLATLAALFLLGPLIILRQEIAWVRALSAGTIDFTLLVLLAALRAWLAVWMQRRGHARRGRPYAEFG